MTNIELYKQQFIRRCILLNESQFGRLHCTPNEWAASIMAHLLLFPFDNEQLSKTFLFPHLQPNKTHYFPQKLFPKQKLVY